jgi:hypothetical protein
MGRGLSQQQRRILAVAYGAWRDRAAEYAKTREAEAFVEKIGVSGAAWRGRPAPAPRHGPSIPPPHITHNAALLALYGWRSGKQDRDWWARRRRQTSDTMAVSRRYNARGEAIIARISRADYETAHASTARTLARLVERGLLEPHHRYGWYLTEAGLRWCAAWADEKEAA